MSVNDRYTSIMNDRTNEINSRLLPRISLEAQANQLPHQQRYLSPSQTTLSHTDHAAPDHFNYQQPQTTVQQQQQQPQQQQPYSYDTPQPYSYAQYPSTRVTDSPNPDPSTLATATPDGTVPDPSATAASTRRLQYPTIVSNSDFSNMPRPINTSSITCIDCGEQFPTTTILRRHQKIDHHRQTYKCRTCGDLFASNADRQTHKNNTHFSLIRITVKNNNFREFPVGTELTSSRDPSGYFVCPAPYCSFVTRIPGYWNDHINTVEHAGIDPQKRKRRKGTAAATAAGKVTK